ncbi:DNA internalization-related competence protein ComEC/Rec2 [Legionella waltersii]|uniref:DNA uptake/competence protein ComA n=1 Tax=Legionella waltersii TaxID=66969 RepID=A0A0W1A049_9GAMM|nr:DNA internalization-related competence protein ComEC/Rec2 [Legionella waltersii]KTD74712.1 DNA uptake/competence protein ComA [Legionella waltersii]SNU99996.1 DNA uptake/competence protein ComA [Legionella waltersii]
MEIVCFYLGILFVYTQEIYLIPALLLLYFLTPKYRLILYFLGACSVAWIHECIVFPKGLPEKQVIPYAIIEGIISSIPNQNTHKTQFHLSLQKFNDQAAKGVILLSWYNHPPKLKAGQTWRLKVKLKKPRNFKNPGSYNYTLFLSARHIHWTGYILPKGSQLLSTTSNELSLLPLRERLANSIASLAHDKQIAAILEALTLNIATHIAPETWELFRRTGTIHLFGISGEHIAFIAGILFYCCRWIWSRFPACCLCIPARSFAGVCSLIVAFMYSLLAGFEPPVQRALSGYFFFTLGCVGSQRFTPWQIWRYALFVVLCIDPHAVFMQGFYFSFGAVACLLITHQRWQLKGYQLKLALQLSCLIGLLPLSFFWYGYGSINGFIANLFAIPLVGFLIVPLALMTLLFSSQSWSWILMKPLSLLVSLLLKGLALTEYLSTLNINWSIQTAPMMLSLLFGIMMLAILPTKPFKHIAILWIVIPLFPHQDSIKSGEALVNVLDVGQGLSVVIRTQNHVLVYDTGDQFFQGSDLGKMVVLPFLNSKGIKSIDAVVISHPDKDHMGGLGSIEQSLPVDRLIVDDPDYYNRGLNCHTFHEWRWDKVTFKFFPIHEVLGKKNNHSCVLRVSNSVSSILLTGDIEAVAEDYLVRTYSNQLNSEVFIVPHHGSSTSSSYRFLLDVNPRYAIASLGFDNRFHFPHDKTTLKLKSLNIPFIRTDESGMVQIKLPKNGHLYPPEVYS